MNHSSQFFLKIRISSKPFFFNKILGHSSHSVKKHFPKMMQKIIFTDSLKNFKSFRKDKYFLRGTYA
tara:strand:+ start:116 stop:316 length:201 start_codon:yes stop_codon:yes gene_type:complete